MNDIIAGVSAIGIIIGIVEVAKQTGLPTRYAPLVSLLLGVLLTTAYAIADQSFSAASVLMGLTFGLSASGLYSGVRAVTE